MLLADVLQLSSIVRVDVEAEQIEHSRAATSTATTEYKSLPTLS